MLRGEALDGLSRELGVPIYRLEEWREKALTGVETALKRREGDPVQADLDEALKRIGELSMENELLCDKVARLEGGRPLARRRSRRTGPSRGSGAGCVRQNCVREIQTATTFPFSDLAAHRLGGLP